VLLGIATKHAKITSKKMIYTNSTGVKAKILERKKPAKGVKPIIKCEIIWSHCDGDIGIIFSTNEDSFNRDWKIEKA
jgi:hypothetical protein